MMVTLISTFASSTDLPDTGSDDVPERTAVGSAEDETDVALVVGVSAVGKLLRSQASCSGVNGGGVLITETAGVGRVTGVVNR